MTSYVEFADCGSAVLDEQPAKLAEAIRLFLQGLGYSKKYSLLSFFIQKFVFLVSHLSIPRYSTANRLAEQSAEYKRQHGSFSKVPRRLSSQVDSGNYNQDYPTEFEEQLQLHVDSFENPNFKV